MHHTFLIKVISYQKVITMIIIVKIVYIVSISYQSLNHISTWYN